VAHVNADLALDVARYFATGDADYAVDAQRKGLLCPDKSAGLKLTTKGVQFMAKWAPKG
jgi:hypothetical protein